MTYEIAVIGGGHAGCEAALAAARMGARTVLMTLRKDRIGHMPCNPAVGGLGKGHIVKELDALGGEIGAATDRAGIQFRMLNRTKGTAVWSPRAQTDKRRYARGMRGTLESQPGLEVIEAEVEAVIVERGAFAGLRLADGSALRARMRGHHGHLSPWTDAHGGPADFGWPRGRAPRARALGVSAGDGAAHGSAQDGHATAYLQK